jgi:predicted nuclease of predicted toxin-antitoxin system
MTCKFLIDNCLSPRLVELARTKGYAAMHLRDLRLSERQDWQLASIIGDDGWTFVTRNVKDFVGPKGQYRRMDRHEGLVCLTWPEAENGRTLQLELFAAVLDAIADLQFDPRGNDLAGQVVAVTVSSLADLDLTVERYELPTGSWGGSPATTKRPRRGSTR